MFLHGSTNHCQRQNEACPQPCADNAEWLQNLADDLWEIMVTGFSFYNTVPMTTVHLVILLPLRSQRTLPQLNAICHNIIQKKDPPLSLDASPLYCAIQKNLSLVPGSSHPCVGHRINTWCSSRNEEVPELRQWKRFRGGQGDRSVVKSTCSFSGAPHTQWLILPLTLTSSRGPDTSGFHGHCSHVRVPMSNTHTI